MRRFIVILIICAVWTQCSFAQNSTSGNNTKAAWEVWNDFKANPSNMYIFLDGLAASDSPQDFCQYVEEFVDICIKRGIEWNTLYEELVETVVPKSPEVTTYYALTLCKHASNYAEIIKTFDLLPKFNTFDNKSKENIVMYPDGRIAMKITNKYMQYGYDIYDLAKNSSGPDLFPYPYHDESVTLLYQPSGDLQIGLFKVAGKDGFFDVNNSTSDDKLDLFIGFILNRQGVKIGEKYDQYDSFAKLEQKKKHEEELETARENANFDKKNNDIEKRLVAKYGQKAYYSLANAKPYVGMPEGLVRDLCIYCGDGQYRVLYKYAYTLIKTGHKVYKETGGFSLAGVKAPQLIYTLNGRVTGWKY